MENIVANVISSPSDQLQNATEKRTEENQNKTDWLMLSVCFTFVAALAIWFYFDNSLPYWDAASHIQDSAKYSELFHHFRPWQAQWIHNFLTENFNYPLTIHAFDGLLMAILGCSAFSVNLSLLIFSCVLNFSLYGIVNLLFKDKIAAALAVVIINCYPCVSSLSHIPMLDFPHLSLHCLAALSLFWWYFNPSWKKSIIAGICLALALTSKQIAAFYFVVPCLALWVGLLVKQRKTTFAQLSLIGAIAAIALLIWVLPNWVAIKQFSAALPEAAGKTDQVEVFLRNAKGFFVQIPTMMSPALFYTFILSSLITLRQIPKLILPSIGAILGVVLLSGVACQNPESRYLIVILWIPAVITALALSKLLQSKNQVMESGAALLVAGMFLQFIAYNYFPYPLSRPRVLLWKLSNFAGRSANTFSNGEAVVAVNPTPPGDIWGQKWIVDKIREVDQEKTSWLNVMPSTAEINVHTLELAALYEKCHVRPTTFRLWTLSGDQINYSQDKIAYFQWFLFKTGKQGLPLKNEESELNYQKIQDYVSKSGHYYLYATRRINDGSELSLFRVKE